MAMQQPSDQDLTARLRLQVALNAQRYREQLRQRLLQLPPADLIMFTSTRSD